MSDKEDELELLTGVMRELVHVSMEIIKLGIYCQTMRQTPKLSLETINALDSLAYSTQRYISEMDKMRDFAKDFVKLSKEEGDG